MPTWWIHLTNFTTDELSQRLNKRLHDGNRANELQKKWIPAYMPRTNIYILKITDPEIVLVVSWSPFLKLDIIIGNIVMISKKLQHTHRRKLNKKKYVHIKEAYENGSKAKPDETNKNPWNSQEFCCRIGTIHHQNIQCTWKCNNKKLKTRTLKKQIVFNKIARVTPTLKKLHNKKCWAET